MRNDRILKVFHSGRQDLEIFYHLMGDVPQAIFDTQIGAMVCGYGDQVSYENLVTDLVKKPIDKRQQFSDWQHRPLSPEQILYAQSDVTYLRIIYQILWQKIIDQDRFSWIEEELASLKKEETYQVNFETLWMKINPKNTHPAYLARLKVLTILREKEAIHQNRIRKKILSDDVLNEIAWKNPKNLEALRKIRGLPTAFFEPGRGREILTALEEANALPPELCPKMKGNGVYAKRSMPTQCTDLLRTFLRAQCVEHKVAEKLLASAQDIEDFLLLDEKNQDHRLLQGWRYTVFGKDAWEIKQGRKALALVEKTLKVVDMPSNEEKEAALD